MATVINDKDKILQQATVRLPSSAGNSIYFSNSSPVFRALSSTTAEPSSYAIEAKFNGQITGTVTWSVVSGTISSTSGQNGNTWTISYTQLTTPSAVVRATLDYLGTTYTNEFTISKVADASAVDLTATSSSFSYDSAGGSPSPATSVITATGRNLIDTVFYEFILGTTTVQNTTSNTYTYTPPSSFSNMPQQITVRLRDKSSTGIVLASSVLSLQAGRPGVSPVSVFLSKEAHVFPALSSGSVVSYSNSGTTIKVFDGLSELTYDGIGTANGTWTISTTPTNITVGTITDSGSFVTIGDHSSFADGDTLASIIYTVSGKTLAGVAFSVQKVQSFAKAIAGQLGLAGPTIDISDLTTIYKNAGGQLSPATLTVKAITTNILNPTYSWTFVGATPATSTNSSVTITPTGATIITATLTVSGSNITTPITISRGTTIVEQGATGQAGANGVMSAFPTIYRWTSGSTPARPTTLSTYTWATGLYSAPTNWSTTAPTNTNPGWVLWEITVPLTVTANTVSSSLDWTDTKYAIRATTVNGSNGSNGADGSSGAGFWFVNRGSSSSSAAPTDAEVLTATGSRYAVVGDLVTINYNSGSNSVAYRATTNGPGGSWALQTTYISGSLIVQNSISGDRIVANSLSVDRLTSGTSSLNIGQFGLGGTDTLNGFTGVGRFRRTSLAPGETSGFVTVTFNDVASDEAGAVAGCHIGPGWGVIGYNTTNTQINAFATVGGLASKTTGGLFKYNRSINTPGNLAQIPFSILVAGTDTYGAYAAYYGQTATDRITEGIIAGGPNIVEGGCGAYFLKFNSSGGGQAKRIFLAQGIYSFNAPTGGGVGYVGDGFAPFTGIHDGIVNSAELPEPGDILVDHKVVEHIDISNSIVEFKLSSTANQKSPIGVCSVIHDTPPTDWSVSEIAVPTYQDISREVMPDAEELPTESASYNPSSYRVPANYKVVYVNALGEGLINVCGESGNIAAGDLIVTSSIPGKGMKQADDIVRSYTVAKARESVTFDNSTQVKQIACIYLCG